MMDIIANSYEMFEKKSLLVVFHLQINCIYCLFNTFTGLKPVPAAILQQPQRHTPLARIACR